MLTFLIIAVNGFCTIINGFCFTKAKARRDVYPTWYLIMTGFFTVYCFVNLLIGISRL